MAPVWSPPSPNCTAGVSPKVTVAARPPSFVTTVSTAVAPSTRKTPVPPSGSVAVTRSEEHTSELQSRENLVCRLLLEKKRERSTDCRQGRDGDRDAELRD